MIALLGAGAWAEEPASSDPVAPVTPAADEPASNPPAEPPVPAPDRKSVV